MNASFAWVECVRVNGLCVKVFVNVIVLLVWV